MRHFASIFDMDGKDGLVAWMGCLEVLLLAYVFIYLLWCVLGTWSTWMHVHWTWSWWGTVQMRRPWTLLTGSLSHARFVPLAYTLLQLYQVGPWLIGRFGTDKAMALFFGASVLTSLSSMIVKKWKGQSSWEGCGASSVWLSMRVLMMLMTVNIGDAGSMQLALSIGKLLASQLVMETILLGDTDMFGHLSGVAFALSVRSTLISPRQW